MVRAIWSAPPPVPAGTMNSTGRVGSHAADAGTDVIASMKVPSAAAPRRCKIRDRVRAIAFPPNGLRSCLTGCSIDAASDPLVAYIIISADGVNHRAGKH